MLALAATAHFRLASRAVLFDETGLLEQDGVGQTFMTFLVGEIDGNVATDLIQHLAVTQVLGELHHIPATAKYNRGTIVLGLLDCSGNDFLEELVHISVAAHDCSY